MTLEELGQLKSALAEQVAKVIVGQAEAVELLLIAVLSRGHVLLEGPPGTAKTLLGRTFAAALKLDFGRIQFTPDLMPGDVLGTNLFNFETNSFAFVKGPIFTELLLADEINRTPPKTQAALLEAMNERQITIDGATHDLGAGFMVVATQNPIEQQGTYPLPEAQLDRFLFKHIIDYPSRDDERGIVGTHGHRSGMPEVGEMGVAQVADLAQLEAARNTISGLRLAEPIVDYVVDLARATRENPSLQYGVSPRAAAVLATCSRACAALDGRDFVIPDDVKRMATPVFRHRVILSPGAEIEGLDADGVIEQIIESVDAPR